VLDKDKFFSLCTKTGIKSMLSFKKLLLQAKIVKRGWGIILAKFDIEFSIGRVWEKSKKP
jgi:hypothetical protein